MEQVIGFIVGILLPSIGLYSMRTKMRSRHDRAVDEAVRLLERF